MTLFGILAFVAGCAAGAFGLLVFACCVVGSRAERRAEAMRAAPEPEGVVGRIGPDARASYDVRLAQARAAYEQEQGERGMW